MRILNAPRKLAQSITRSLWRTRLFYMGDGAEIHARVRLEYPDRISLGNDACVAFSAILRANTEVQAAIAVGHRSHVGEFSILAANRGHIRVGDDSWIGSHCELQGNGTIVIGRDVMIGSHCVLNTVAHNIERADVPMHRQGLSCAPIQIEDDVWLGTGVKVLKGVRIGRGSVIGAGAVVTRDVPPYSIAVGVPARVTGQRAHRPTGELIEMARYRAEGESCQ